MKNTIAIVLAAGKSTRMKSKKSKLLHEVLGKSVIQRVALAIQSINPKQTVFVVSHQKQEIENNLQIINTPKIFVDQGNPKGTGHAILKAIETISIEESNVLVIAGDIPLITTNTLNKLQNLHLSSNSLVTFITMKPQNLSGYGRVLRNSNGKVIKIIEQSELNETTTKITECNSGIYIYNGKWLKESIYKLQNNNNKGEIFLTDLIELASGKVSDFEVSETEVTGVNTRFHLEQVSKVLQKQIIDNLMLKGVGIHFPNTVTIYENTRIESDVEIEKCVTIKGNSIIKSGAYISQGSIIENSIIEENALIKPYSIIENSLVGNNAQIGPFARIRPQSSIGEYAKVGNFVEIKKSVLKDGVKASHLSYIGDTEIGKHSNIGAGTITCNYDGKNKYKTIIGEKVFVGSDTQIIAPCTIGNNVYIGSGTTVMKNITDNTLVINPKKQINKELPEKFK